MRTLPFICQITLCCLAIVALSGCLGDATRRADEAKRRMESTARMRWLADAVKEHQETRGKYPDSLEELRPLFGAKKGSERLQKTFETVSAAIGTVTFDD